MNISRKFNLIRVLMAIVIALFLTIVITFCISERLLDAIKYFLLGSAMKFKRLANMIEMTMPLLFTGLSVSLICRTGIFNLVSEPFLFIGGSVAAILAIKSQLSGMFPPIACIFLGGLTGMACMYIPVKIRQKFGSSETISSLIFNYLIFYLCGSLIRSFVRNPDSRELRLLDFPENAMLFKLIPTTRVHAGLLITIVFMIVFWLYSFKSRWGYKMRISGSSPKFALYSGTGVSTLIVITHLFAGLACGVGGAYEMLGIYSAFKRTIVPRPGYGRDGIIAAILARDSPALVPVRVFLLVYMRVGADIMIKLTDVQNEIASITQGVVTILIAVQSFLGSMERKAIYKEVTVNAGKGDEQSMDVFHLIFNADFLVTTVRMTAPIMFVGLAALIVSQAGMMNLAIGSTMLTLALVGVIISARTHNTWAGLIGAVLIGILMSRVIGYATSASKADMYINGVAFNLMMSGGTVFIMYLTCGSKGMTTKLQSAVPPTVTVPLIKNIPVFGKIMPGQHLLTYAAVLCMVFMNLSLYRTKIGLRLRMVGENPEAAESVGINSVKMKMLAMCISGGMPTLGGVLPSTGYVSWFQAGMTDGRGFVEMAAAALGGDRPLGSLPVSLSFGPVDALAMILSTSSIPSELVSMIPYFLTIIGLTISSIIMRNWMEYKASYQKMEEENKYG